MKPVTWITLALLSLGRCAFAADGTRVAAVVELSPGAPELAQRFDRDRKSVRLLMLLSPG